MTASCSAGGVDITCTYLPRTLGPIDFAGIPQWSVLHIPMAPNICARREARSTDEYVHTWAGFHQRVTATECTMMNARTERAERDLDAAHVGLNLERR
jgi:hypothetical protein